MYLWRKASTNSNLEPLQLQPLQRAYLTGLRLVFGEGVYALAILTAILLAVFRGVTDWLIPLYAVGASMAFILSQAEMVVRWKRVGGPGAHKSMFLNGLGAIATAITVAVVIGSDSPYGLSMSVYRVKGIRF